VSLAQGSGRATIGASLQTIATATGLSKSAVQIAVRHLVRRKLVSANRARPTEAPVYEVHEPWLRTRPSAGGDGVEAGG
jgi:DNA-binding transcriptional regulator GbsR (MarR family)